MLFRLVLVFLVFLTLYAVHYISRVALNTLSIKYQADAPTLETFLVRGDVFRTAFSMTSWLHCLASCLRTHKQSTAVRM
jgi:hypothetical protein